MNKEQLTALQELDCIEGALNEAKRLVKSGAKPEDIMRDFNKTRTSRSWIIVVANMASWWKQHKDRMEGK
jgi:hypothetical protein|tara:strand:+ start:3972 stop:4181 length:210 start_codon:yes stop_codon:yes gene_type:complete